MNKLASELLRPNFFKVSIGQGCDGLPSTINQKFIETRKYSNFFVFEYEILNKLKIIIKKFIIFLQTLSMQPFMNNASHPPFKNHKPKKQQTWIL